MSFNFYFVTFVFGTYIQLCVFICEMSFFSCVLTYDITKKLVSVGDRVKVFLRFVGGILKVPYLEFLLIRCILGDERCN